MADAYAPAMKYPTIAVFGALLICSLSRAEETPLESQAPPVKPQSPQQAAIQGFPAKILANKLPHEKTGQYIQRLAKAAFEANKQISHLTAEELRQKYLEKDPLVMQASAVAQLTWEQDEHRGATYGDPGRVGFHTRPDDAYIRALEIKAPDVEEKVSLREEFKKLGVKPTQQIGGSCSFYSMYHMVQFAALKEGRRPPALGAMQAASLRNAPAGLRGRNVPHICILPAIQEVYGKRPHVRHIDMGIPKLSEEVLKQELRNGRPCRVTVRYKKNTIQHSVIVIGFHTKDGKTRYEYLDSNLTPTENGSGYNFMPNEHIASSVLWDASCASHMFSMWFE